MKLIVLLGQTSSGKSDMSVELAHKLNGEVCIVSADSRQVYKGLDLGTGKVEGVWQDGVYLYGGVKHFLIDYVNPSEYYTLIDYTKDFYDLFENYKPDWVILTGGTGLYTRAISDNFELNELKPEYQLQFDNLKEALQKKTKEELQTLADKTSLNESDYNNPRRLINKILNTEALNNKWFEPVKKRQFDKIYKFGINVDTTHLRDKIYKRIVTRIENGMLEEIKKAKQQYGLQRMLDLGLEYKWTSLYLNNEYTYEDYLSKLTQETNQYAKRQLTWLKKENNLIWINNLGELLDILK